MDSVGIEVTGQEALALSSERQAISLRQL